MSVRAASAMEEQRDTEIVLGTGKLLGIFFFAVGVCALFFALGFNLGRASAPVPDPNVAVAQPSSGGNNGSKPSAARAATGSPCPPGQVCGDAVPATPETSAPPTTPEATAPAASDSELKPVASAAPSSATTRPLPAATPGGNFVVQIAAVTRREDADALLGALKKKNYPVFVVGDSPDHLFRVQLGPYTDRKDAQDMRERLAAEGYNSIIK